MRDDDEGPGGLGGPRRGLGAAEIAILAGLALACLAGLLLHMA